jgi:hypothetical protein
MDLAINSRNITKDLKYFKKAVEKSKLNKIIDDFKMPKISELKHNGKLDLGGTKEMHQFLDNKGNKYLFKVAESSNKIPQIERAYVQQAFSVVQKLISPNTYVPVVVRNFNGKIGSLQPQYQYKLSSTEIGEIQNSNIKRLNGLIDQFQREHVIDFLLYSFDSHGRNFLVDRENKLRGLDKEQAFKYIDEKGAKHISLYYHPNAVYDEIEPIYNRIFRAFKYGQIRLDKRVSYKYIDRVEKIDDNLFKEIFKKYAVTRFKGDSKKVEDFLEKLIHRKHNLRKEFDEFYKNL